MRQKEPIKHHYIPKFILRPFCFADGGLHIYDKMTGKICDSRIEDAFMVRNLYRDESTNPDNPVQIESNLARFESEVSHLIRKFIYYDDVVISLADDEKLRLFLAIMGFRSNSTCMFFESPSSAVCQDF